MLNRVWLSFFVLGFASCLWQGTHGHPEVYAQVVEGLFRASRQGVEIAIGLAGLMCFWLGIFKIADEAGLVRILARGLNPLFRRLMPEVPADHPALGAVTMNIAANMLGLDNAATPLGLAAMRELQALNPRPDTATNAQILFLVLNTASVTLIPVSIFMYRAQQGAANPAAVFIPILMASAASAFSGVAVVAFIQKLRIDRVVWAYMAGFCLLLATLISYLLQLRADELGRQSAIAGNALLLGIVVLFLMIGWWRRVEVYDHFVEGAKQGFKVAVDIIPYLVGMLAGIALLRTSGLFDSLLSLISLGVNAVGWDSHFVPALPTALMKTFSGSGARAMMLETMHTYGVDSFPARVAAVVQGSSETTFYVLAVYFGSVGIRKERYALACGLWADAVSVVAAIGVCYWFFPPH